ncbi:hypothetical protein AB5J56_13220 [Streptomyces sp. R21]|uniref:Excreted virulence factor EspC (Type VII ESX diderm) n=1 Tax=Streptomyces sp. R21 TaxID=3238627 RepID=A0AB39P420_9ACTN
MAWEEWEQLKSAAAERHSTGMQLNQLPADQAGPSASKDLRSNKATWTKAGQGVSSLREDITKALTKLAEGQKGFGGDSGCLTVGVQKSVYESWERYIKDVSGRCGALAELLEKVGSDQLKTDDAVGVEIANMNTEYADTPAAGGQAEGR